MKISIITAVVSLALTGCVIVAPTAANVEGDGRYLQMTAAGSPIVQMDLGDNATCKSMGNNALKNNPLAVGLTRCASKPFDNQQVPYSYVIRDKKLGVESTFRFKTEAMCKQSADNTASKRGDAVVARDCAKI